MKNIEITTAQKVTIQYELASPGNRITAFFIDLIILMTGLVTINLLVLQAIGYNSESYEYFAYLIILPIILFYSLFSEIIFDGQTLGKKIMKLKVLKINGEPAAAFDYLIRWAFRFVDIWISAGSVATLLISSSPKNQRLGCMLSGTTVIRLSSTRIFTLKDILNIYSIENYDITYPNATRIPEKDMIFLKTVLDRWKKYKNIAHKKILDELAYKTAEIIEVARPKDNEAFLRKVLSDYIVLTR